MLQKLKERGRKEITSRLTLEPVHIVWKQGEVENEQVLLKCRSRQISLNAADAAILRTEKQTASILLDFGCEIHGGIRIQVWEDSTKKGARARIRFGESASEAMSELGGNANATNDHARRDMEIQLGMMSMNPVGETGFRFVRIDLLDEGQIALKSVTAVLVYKDVPYRGEFCCSDELLNRIWNVGAYTVHLNMQEYVWDGIKRDRLVWVGDMHPETMTIWNVFGEDDSVKRSLDFIRNETPLPGWMNGLPTYTMWYVIIVHDWFIYTGDTDWLRQQADYLKGVARQLSMCIGEDGKNNIPEGRFLDWPSNDKEVVTDAGIQAIHTMAAEKLSYLFQVLEEKELEMQCREDIEKLKRYQVDYEDSKQAAALLVLAGLKDAGEINDRLLKKGGAAGMSAFMGYYILAARAKAGDIQGSLEAIRQYWGGMLSLGATTFWEDFDVEWLKGAASIDRLPEAGEVDIHSTYGRYCYQGYRHSLCHGWASGPTSWMMQYLLGIEVLEPGCKKIAVRPSLGDLMWVKGAFPTPYGNVIVQVTKDEKGKLSTKIEAPNEVTVVLEKEGNEN